VEITDYIKEHPYLVGGIAVAVVVGFVVLRGASGSSGAASTTDPNAAAEYAYAGQQAQIKGQESVAALQASYGLQVATLQSDTQRNQDGLAATVALYQTQQQSHTADLSIAANLDAIKQQAAVQITGIQDQLAAIESNNATTVSISQINADEQSKIAALTAGVETTISNNQTTLGLAQTAGAVNIADTASNNAVKIAKNNSSSNLFGSALGLVGAALL
jgi:hypothetical protein